MKFFTATALLVAAVASVVVCIPFLPGAKERADLFAVQVRMQTSASGKIQVYYDSGSGFEETKSAYVPLTPGSAPANYTITLPPGRYIRLRLDPVDSDGVARIESVRIVTRSGEVRREVPLAQIGPAHQIERLQVADGALAVTPEHGGMDPQLLIVLDPPVVLTESWQLGVAGWWRHAAEVFAGFAIVLFLVDRATRLRTAAAKMGHGLGMRPTWAIFAIAALGVIVSAYPVVFMGRSYVSPNMGTVLLYDQFPTLPGYTDATTTDVMGSDIGAIMWQHIPFSSVQRRALLHGEVPLWNRYNTTGTPLLGQGQSMFGDPLHLLVVAADSAAWAWDLKYLLAKTLFAAGLGLLVWSVVSRLPDANHRIALGSALVVAAVAPFIGFFVYRINHPAFFSVCYAPWPLLCGVRIAQAVNGRSAAKWCLGLLVANLALMNSGTAKEAYMLLLTMNFAGACVLFVQPTPWRERLTKLGLLLWTGVLFTLITAPIWSTFLHELHGSYTSYNAAAAYQIQPALLLGFFDEAFYRLVMPNERTFNPSLNFVLLLGFLYFVATLRTHLNRRTVIGLAVASVLPLSLAFGLIPAEWIVRVPLLANVVHVDNTFSCALIVLWSVLAGVGFAHAATRLGKAEGRADLTIVGVLLFGLVFAWVAFRQVVHRPIYGTAFTVNDGHPLAVARFVWGYLASLLLASATLLWVARRTAQRGRLNAACAFAIGLCAVVFCWRFAFQAPSTGFESYVVRPTVRVDFHASSPAVRYLQEAQSTQPGRVQGVRGNFFPGWNDAYGLEAIHGPDALMSPWYRELTDAMGGIKRIWDWRLYLEPDGVATARPYLDALNVRYYVDALSDVSAMPSAVRLVEKADLAVFESRTCWPRAFFTSQLYVYDHVTDFVARIHDNDGRPFAAVDRTELKDDEALASLWGDWQHRSVAAATHYRRTENATAFDVHADAPGVVVLTEAFWPGDFRVFVNGTKQKVLRLNHAFMGVAVPGAGDYHIEFRCVPKGWYRNLSLCGAGLLLLAISVVLVRRAPSPGMRGDGGEATRSLAEIA
jgi:hypothetical protein